MPKETVKIDVLTDTKKAKAGLKGLMGNLLKIGGVVAGLKGLQSVLNSSIGAYKKQIEAESKLMAVLKATGNQTGMSSKQLKEYAMELQNLTGVGDAAIINSQALMATFTQIGGEVFPDAIKTALDMSKAFGSDLKLSTIQLGKALNDPIRGISALSDIGVSFTVVQKDMIRGFVEVGDVASAQKVILDELAVEVGGVAEAYGATTVGQMERFKASIGDLSEGLGEAIMVGMAPLVEEANKFFQNNKRQIINILRNIPGIFMAAFELVGDILKQAFSWDSIKDSFATMGMGFVKGWKMAFFKIVKFFKNMFKFMLAPVLNFGAWLGSVFKNIFGKVGNFFIDVLNKIPFVELEKKIIAPIKNIKDVFFDTTDDMEDAFLGMVGTIGEYAVETAGIWTEMGATIGKTFAPAVDDFLAKLDEIVNKEEEIIEVAGGLGDALGDALGDGTGAAELFGVAMTNMSHHIVNTTDWAQLRIQYQVSETARIWAEKIDFIKIKYAELESVVSKISASITGIITQGLKNQTIALENKYAVELEGITQSQLSEEEKQTAIAALDEKFAKRRGALKRKQAIAEKAAAIVKSLIDTASAVVEVLPNIPLAIAMGILGAAGTAAIAAQPIPAFAQGGSFMTSGPQLIQVGDNASGRERVSITPDDDRSKKMQVLNIDGKEFVGWLQDKIDTGGIRLARSF